MLSRTLQLTIVSLAALLALAPDAHAQRGRGRGGRGGGGARALGGARQRAAKAPTVTSTAYAPASGASTGSTAAPKSGQLKQAEDEFRKMLARIDLALVESETARSRAADSQAPLGSTISSEVERGTFEWRALQRPVFMTIDYDHNGWLSYNEARASVGLDRAEFALYDRDRDGRIALREFVVRYDEIVAQTGAFRVPTPDPKADWTKAPSAAAMRNECDRDADGALDVDELADLLERWKRPELGAASVLEKLDVDGDGRLGHGELATLAHLADAAVLGGDGSRRTGATNVVEMFGAVTPNNESYGATKNVPRVVGPIPHFVRLDLDRDGMVTLAELARLQEGSGLATRAGAVLAAMDLNGDNRLTEREFLSGLSSAAGPARR